jgi:hypothetical protein
MKRLAIVLVAFSLCGFAEASGLAYAVDSLQKAQALAKQSAGRHVLVFYTSPT